MSKKYLEIDLTELSGGSLRQAIYFADCIRGSGPLVGVVGDHLIRAPRSYHESFKGSCLVEKIAIPLDEVKADPFSAMRYDIKTNLTPSPFWDMDGFAATDMLEGLCNGSKCQIDFNALPTGVRIVDEESNEVQD